MIFDIDKAVPEEERFDPHHRLTFATNQRWRLFDRSWQAKTLREGSRRSTDATTRNGAAREGSLLNTGDEASKDDDSTAVVLSNEDIARRDLLGELSHGAAESGGLLDESWFKQRYSPTDKLYGTPLSLNGEVTYDFSDAERRAEQQAVNDRVADQLEVLQQKRAALEADQAAAEAAGNLVDAGRIAEQIDALNESIAVLERQRQALPEPWKDPKIDFQAGLLGWTLGGKASYSVYAKTTKELDVNLTFPPVLSTTVATGYSVTKEINLANGDLRRKRERRLNVTSSLIPTLTSFVSLKRRSIDRWQPTYAEAFETAVGAEYLSSSDCWGLRFSRLKEYGNEEREAAYILQLSVVFLGEPREFPNMASGAQSVVRIVTRNTLISNVFTLQFRFKMTKLVRTPSNQSSEKIPIQLAGFNNLTKALSFNLYDFCVARDEGERRAYVDYIAKRYNAAKVTAMLRGICDIIEANVLAVSDQDYDPWGASSLVLMSDLKGGGATENIENSTTETSSSSPYATKAMHLDKSHICAHSYPDFHGGGKICSFRMDIDIATCGEITPLSALNYMFKHFDSDVVVIDYVVRGFTRTHDGQRVYMDHKLSSIQDYVESSILADYHCIDLALQSDNIWQTKMLRINQDEPAYFLPNDVDLQDPENRQLLKAINREMRGILHMWPE